MEFCFRKNAFFVKKSTWIGIIRRVLAVLGEKAAKRGCFRRTGFQVGRGNGSMGSDTLVRGANWVVIKKRDFV